MREYKPLIIVTSSTDMPWMQWNWWSWQCIEWALQHYQARAVLITPDTPKPLPKYDGLLLSGGADIHPSRYGQQDINSFYCEPQRDELEFSLLKEAEENGIPVLGICRGAQLINIAHGGSLHQDANRKFRYYTPASNVFAKLFKRKQSFISGSKWLKDIFDPQQKQRITSLHHQTIDELGSGLMDIADDHHGMIQAIEGTGEHFLLGVQWHPEYQLLSPKQRAIFGVFVQACRKQASL